MSPKVPKVVEVQVGLTGWGRCLELRQERKPADLAMRLSLVTFSGASLVGQTAKPQGGQADGGSNLQVKSKRAGYGSCSFVRG